MSNFFALLNKIFSKNNLNYCLYSNYLNHKDLLIREFNGKKLFSFNDERSMMYYATGICAESQQPVIVLCNQENSRNCMPGLTEAFYRQLPVLLITIYKDYFKLDYSKNINDVFINSFSIDNSSNAILNLEKSICNLLKKPFGPLHLEVNENILLENNLEEFRYLSLDMDKMYSNIGIYIGTGTAITTINFKIIIEEAKKKRIPVFANCDCIYKDEYLVPSGRLNYNQLDYLVCLENISNNIDIKYKIVELDKINKIDKRVNAILVEDIYETIKSIKVDNTKLNMNNHIQSYNKFFDLAAKLNNKIDLSFNLILNYDSYLAFNNYKLDCYCYTNYGLKGQDGILSSMLGVSLYRKKNKNIVILNEHEFIRDMNVLTNSNFPDNVCIILLCDEVNKMINSFLIDLGYKIYNYLNIDEVLTALNNNMLQKILINY